MAALKQEEEQETELMCELLGPTAGAGDEMESDEPPEEHVGRAKPNLFIDLTRYRTGSPLC